MPYVFKHLEVYMKTWFHYCFIKKWFHTILYHFNQYLWHRMASQAQFIDQRISAISQWHSTPFLPNEHAISNVSVICTLHWRHNEPDGVSNHQPRYCLLNCLFRCRTKKTPKLRVTGLCAENSPHKRPTTRKLFPFDDVIMYACDMIWTVFYITGLLRREFVGIVLGYFSIILITAC